MHKISSFLFANCFVTGEVEKLSHGFSWYQNQGAPRKRPVKGTVTYSDYIQTDGFIKMQTLIHTYLKKTLLLRKNEENAPLILVPPLNL